ncbi:MAG: hypothetical protein A3B90_02505 [Candidatus Magasanikbacteria bacterium RIFCSPHIGHO2_02_FULL_41_13]|uniref:Uncharacterized protein n=1 Tax=Candidatus Magasanikbacteria bacterium RIFCSPHIGHO2_02_FULL_41_13 TaxID=1798676 RepID=A0A1F6M3U9_9BACT|nr:MAG: hypothetical protein A3B90_02505 [Candidatus Magasanikbacteria bacterium RIFCSPHIGHO2_02_FULL_41_13]
MTETKTKTKSLTNTHLAVAVVLAFIAGGFAFAAAPAGNRLGGPKCGMNMFKAVSPMRCGQNQASGADITCHDGSKKSYRPNRCMSLKDLQAYARVACANRCVPQPLPLVAVATGTVHMRTTNFLSSYQNRLVFSAGGTSGMHTAVELTASPVEDVAVESLTFQVTGGNYFMSDVSPGLDQNRVSSDAEVAALLTSVNIYPPDRQVPGFVGQASTNGNTVFTIPLNNVIIPAGETIQMPFSFVFNPSPSSTVFTPSLVGGSFRGLASAQRLNADVLANAEVWPTFDIMPARLNIYSNFQAGQLLAGNQALFLFQMETRGNFNSISGQAVDVLLQSLPLSLLKSEHVDLNNLQLCRSGFDSCIDLFVVTSTPNEIGLGLTPNQAGIDFNNLPAGFENFGRIRAAGTTTFTLIGRVNNPIDGFVQGKIPNLNSGNAVLYGTDANENNIIDRVVGFWPFQDVAPGRMDLLGPVVAN